MGKRQGSDGASDDDEGKPGAPPPQPPNPNQEVTPKEILHKTDVELKLSNNRQDKGHFLRIITNVRVSEYLMYIHENVLKQPSSSTLRMRRTERIIILGTKSRVDLQLTVTLI